MQYNNKILTFTMKQLLSKGLHIGHHKIRWNPHISYYLFGIIKNIHIFNLEHTIIALRQLTYLMINAAKLQNKIFFLLTNDNTEIFTKSNRIIQFNTNKWINGYFTNWKEIIKKIEVNLSNNKHSFQLPDLFMLINTNKFQFAIKEAFQLNIPIFSIIDSNSNIEKITYLIPGNNNSIEAIQFYLNIINNSIQIGITEEILLYKKKYQLSTII